MLATDPRRLKTHRILYRGLLGLTCVLAVLWLSSYSSASWLGVVLRKDERRTLTHTTYLRIQWPGNGSLRVGGGSLRRPISSAPEDAFNLEAKLFKSPRRFEPRSLWNRLGFWWVDAPQEDAEHMNDWTFWVGIPSWLPLLLTGAATVLVRRRRLAG